jgi:hypothetical protein
MTPRAALRWLLVLPVAILAAYVAHFVIGMAAWLVLGSYASVQSTGIYYLRLLLFYAPKEAAFVIAGAKVAPRGHLATAFGLAAIAILISLIVHVLGQQSVGVTNYTHFTAESAGAIFGVAFMYFSQQRPNKELQQ